MIIQNHKRIIKIIGALIIIFQIIIDISTNLLHFGNDFSFSKLIKSPAFWVLIITTIIYIVLYLYIEHDSHNNSFSNSEFEKALKENGVYDIAAQKVGKCIESGNLKEYKTVGKILKHTGIQR